MHVESIRTERTVARVHLPLGLRAETAGAGSVEVSCATVGAALEALCIAYPTLRRHIFDETGALRPHVNVFVNDAEARTREGLETAVQKGDEIHVVPSIAGG